MENHNAQPHPPDGTSTSNNLVRDEEIDAYLDGDLPEERMRQIEAMARQDPELAAKLTVVGHFSEVISNHCNDTLQGDKQ